jgi:hypothetical protein
MIGKTISHYHILSQLGGGWRFGPRQVSDNLVFPATKNTRC